ncbi:CRISPR system precrRNA processing endoribonuclease RAMP protein Cas6 [Paenibacillus roseus]
MNTITLRATFAATGKGRLPPYLGSTIRGVLGHCIRSFVCPHPEVKCHLCTISADCAYAQNFCSPGNEAGAVNPYVLRALTRDKADWNPMDTCQFDITLIGKSSEQAGLFIDALQEMQSRGWGASRLPFELQQITNPVQNTLIWNSGKLWMRNCQPRPMSFPERRGRSAVIRFESPVRILVSRQLRHQLSFADLIQSLSRRIALLSHAYTGYQLQWDEEAMMADARRIQAVAESWRPVDFSRYSMTRGGKLDLPAIIGWARYEGDLTPFSQLLAAGELLHVGKNATIGFGNYQVSYDQ